MPTIRLPYDKSICRVAGVEGGHAQKRMVICKHEPHVFSVELEPGAVYEVSALVNSDKVEYLLATEEGTKAVAWEELPKLFGGGK